MKLIRKHFQSLVFAFGIFVFLNGAMLLTFTSCKTPSLATGGPYTTPALTNTLGTNITVIAAHSDLQLYQADASFRAAYAAMDAIFQTEFKNRDYFYNLSPSIKHTLDKIRPIAQQVVNDYTVARAAYMANPTPAGLTGVQALLARLQQLVVAATAAVGQITASTTNSVSVISTNK